MEKLKEAKNENTWPDKVEASINIPVTIKLFELEGHAHIKWDIDAKKEKARYVLGEKKLAVVLNGSDGHPKGSHFITESSGVWVTEEDWGTGLSAGMWFDSSGDGQWDTRVVSTKRTK